MSPISPSISPSLLSKSFYGESLKFHRASLIERVVSHATTNPKQLFYRQDTGLYTYADLIEHAIDCSEKLRKLLPQQKNDTMGERVCILAPSGFEYSVYTLAIWLLGCVSVPLHIGHAVPDMVHYVVDSQSNLIITHPKYEETAKKLLQSVKELHNNQNVILETFPTFASNIAKDTIFAAPDEKSVLPFPKVSDIDNSIIKKTIIYTPRHLDNTKENNKEIILNLPSPNDPAVFIYTSGTTSSPKGVILLHDQIIANVVSLVQAWEWSYKDHIMDFLPKHHIHGVINCLYTAMWVGARVTSPMYKFDANCIFDSILNGIDFNSEQKQFSKEDLQLISEKVQNNEIIQESQNIPALSQYSLNYDIPISNDNETTTISLPISNPTSYTIFTAVPTIYHRLIETYHSYPKNKQQQLQLAFSQFRLMMSGSMALPQTTLQKWKEISGHHLLERYGMSEILMGVSNLYHAKRIPGAVGWALPSVIICVKQQAAKDYDDEDKNDSDDKSDNNSTEDNDNKNSSNDGAVVGELLVRGPTVFHDYYNRPEQTAESFVTVNDENNNSIKWFCTGDIAKITPDGCVRLLGRNSVDILKVGGTKLSALTIERQLLDCPMISSVAVVGLPSASRGQSVAAIVVPDREGEEQYGEKLSVASLVKWARERMTYFPRELDIVDVIPTNAMGKINKKVLISQLMERPEFANSSFRQ